MVAVKDFDPDDSNGRRFSATSLQTKTTGESVKTYSCDSRKSNDSSLSSDEKTSFELLQTLNGKPVEYFESVTSQINKERKRNRLMQSHFMGIIPLNQVCIADFSCALNKDHLLRQGRLYISQEFVCFHSPIKNTKFMFHISELRELRPKSTLLLPTTLDIYLENKEIQLMSLFFRQNAMQCIKTIQKYYQESIKLKQNDEIPSISETGLSEEVETLSDGMLSLTALFALFNVFLLIRSFML
jgi:hypothetical protein